MKEFIDKLIGRLEEEKQRLRKLRNNTVTLTDHEVCAIEEGAFNFCKKAVNELAEEFAPDINVGTNVSEMPTGWIPVSERLPEAGKRYLVSVVWKDEFNNYIRPAVYDAVYGKDGLWHTYDYEPVVYEVIAWQPLPAPLKEGE